MSVPKIVLTGGPCSGKTTGLAKLSRWLAEQGWHPIVVPETATELILAGITPADAPELFQATVLNMQFSREHHYALYSTVLHGQGKQVVMLFDRGVLDSNAYALPGFLQEQLSMLGTTYDEVMHNYDAVVHLVTAADGAEEYYTTANNEARCETPKQARELDRKLKDAWLGHPHHFIIANEGDFAHKLLRLKQTVAHLLGIPEPLECERKFLLANKPVIPTGVKTVPVEIVQVYLSVTPEGSERVRSLTTPDGYTIYTRTEKTRIAGGTSIEREERISAEEFARLLTRRALSNEPIRKTRYFFVWEHQRFELDVFHGKREGLFLLELEVPDMNAPVSLPPWVECIREVTDDPVYSNAQLALA